MAHAGSLTGTLHPWNNRSASSGIRFSRGQTRLVVTPHGFKIVSGGQTGVDRAALDWAMTNKVPHGGYCPAGRRAEDGPIDERYQLTETETPKYSIRTRLNVEHSDATLIISPDPPVGGTLLTLELARKAGKPVLLVNPRDRSDSHLLIRSFIQDHKVGILNVAGPRASSSPKIYEDTLKLLQKTFCKA